MGSVRCVAVQHREDNIRAWRESVRKLDVETSLEKWLSLLVPPAVSVMIYREPSSKLFGTLHYWRKKSYTRRNTIPVCVLFSYLSREGKLGKCASNAAKSRLRTRERKRNDIYFELSQIIFISQVSLQQVIDQNNFCGGVILNEYYILTCAHCIFEMDISLFTVVVGTTDLRLPYARYFPESSYIHERYNVSDSLINDIATIKVKTPFVFSSLVSPVVLPQQDEIVKAGATAVVSGYGRIKLNGERTKGLHIASVTITDQANCKAIYKRGRKIIYDTQICTNEPTVVKGSCLGDSGGPLTVDGKLVGLISWSVSCGNTRFPTIYTRVSSYINWISEHTM
ncbi:PREDICTED: trypsin-7-like [Dinoponera quadriceps]|uniref:Trypsin-7-like n=1 Tax=Dinoponera quadriceps TaxID=609295 RepID=A0A6P3Y719_DINQU|nr:PREDICTED: trypsin-7-like [Dinoponera quadriceps]